MIYLERPSNFNPKFEIALCICLFNNRFLFLQRKENKPQGNQWGVPAGKIDKGETPEQGAKRELFEETSIDLSEKQFQFLMKIYDRFPDLDFVINIFHVNLEKEYPVTIRPEEHQKFAWITLEEALQMDHMQDVDEILKIAFARIKTA